MSDPLERSLSEIIAEYEVLKLATVPKSFTGYVLKLRQEMLKNFIDTAQAILRREPLLVDLNTDVLQAVFSRWKREELRAKALKRRFDYISELSKWCAKTHPVPSVDMEEIRSHRRLPSADGDALLEYLDVPAEDDAKIGEDSHILAMPLTTLLEQHYTRERLVGKSPETTRLYRCSISTFAKHLGRQPVIRDLRQSTVIDFLRHEIAKGKRAASTIEKDRVQLLALWRYCAKKRWLLQYPEIQAVPCPERIPDAWTREDMEKIIEACQSLRGIIGRTPTALWWECLVRIIYDSAERIRAALGIHWTDISTDGWLTVRAETRKGKTRDRRYKLRPETIELLEQMRPYRKLNESTLFDMPFCYSSVWQRFKVILKKAGLPTGRRNMYHKIRRTVASEFEAAGGNATQLLDHESRKTTLGYLDPKIIKSQQPADIVLGIGQKQATAKGSDSFAGELRKLLAKMEGGKQ